MTRFAVTCPEFALTISLKKTNIMAQDVSTTPINSIGNHTQDVVENFTYVGYFTYIFNNLSLDVELNVRIGKSATAMARLAKRMWDNTMLTLNTNEVVPSLRVEHSSLWQRDLDSVLSPRAKVECLSHAKPQKTLGHHLAGLGHKHNILSQTGMSSMFATTQRRLRCLGQDVQDGRWSHPKGHPVRRARLRNDTIWAANATMISPRET